MSDIIDINVGETIEEVTINVVDNLITVNINKVTGGGGSQTLAETLVIGNNTGGTDILLNNDDAIQLENNSSIRKGTYDFGQNGGVSRICGVDFEDMWQGGIRHVFDNNGYIRNSTNCFNVVPNNTFDITLRFKVGSIWTLDDGTNYICTDATEGAAVWELYNVIPTSTSDLTNDGEDGVNPFITAADVPSQVNSDWNATSGVEEILNKPTIPAAQIQSDWTQANTSALDYIKNKPTIPSLTGYVPYTGATADLDLGTNNLTADHISLNVSPSGAGFVVGATEWNNTLGSSQTLLKGGNVTLKNGVDLVARIVNKVVPNTTLTKAEYQVVKVSGASGQRLAVDLARANTDLNSADTLGVVCETITTNQEGFILTVGQLLDVNTTGSLQGETWADGDVLYLSPTTAGKMTNVKPNGSNGHIVVLGYVEYSHSSQGKIYVKIMNGWELDELHNVYISSVANNQGLVYESSSDLWKNKTIIQDSITDGVTTIAPSQNAVFDALALKQNVVSGVSDTEIGYLDGVTSAIQTQLNARCQSLYNLTSQITHTGTTAKTLLLTYFIPANTFTNGDFLNFSAIVTKVANISLTTHTLEINTTNTLTGATTISTAALNTTNFSMKFKREIRFNHFNL